MINKILENKAYSASFMTQESETTTQTTNPVVNGSLSDALDDLAALLSELQAKVSQDLATRSQENSEVSNLQVNLANQNTQKLIDQIKAIQEANEHKSFWQKLVDAVEVIAGAVCCAFGLVTVGIALMAIGIADAFGLMDKLSGAISSVLQKMGIPADVSNLLAQAIIFIAVTMLTAGASGATCEMTLSNLFKGIAATGSGLTQAPALAADAAAVVLNLMPNVSEDEKKKIENIISIVQMVLGALMAIVGGGLAAKFSIGEETNSFVESFKNISKSLDGDMPSLLSAQGQAYLNTANGLVGAAQGTANFATDMIIAKALIKEADAKAFGQIIQMGMTILSTTSSVEIKGFESRLKSQSKAIADIINAEVVEGQSFVNAISA